MNARALAASAALLPCTRASVRGMMMQRCLEALWALLLAQTQRMGATMHITDRSTATATAVGWTWVEATAVVTAAEMAAVATAAVVATAGATD